jgi:hypothetical protein
VSLQSPDLNPPSALPSDWWLDRRIRGQLLGLITPSLGHLLLQVEVRASGERRTAIYSGFFLGHRDRYFWATAGHVIAELQSILRSDTLLLRQAWLRDGQPMENEDASSIPIALDLENMIALEVDDPTDVLGGMDFGLMRLSPLVLEAIRRNPGASFLPAEDSLEQRAWAGLYGIGTPAESVTYSTKRNVRFDIHCLPIEVLDSPPSEVDPVPMALYGRLLQLGDVNRKIASVEGMSGGPVFAVEPRSQVDYGFRLVGVQSAWHRSTRTMRISPIADIIRFIDRTIEHS